MEYKYEMRGLLVDIGIAEEYRSNLLAVIWARGERQTTKEAKEFLDEKLSEGIIDEEQMSSLERIVEAYTVRR
jgi:intergrase/recombinase